MYDVAQIWHHPVKSMQGERLDATVVDERGLLADRGRALIDTATGKVASGSWAARRWADLVMWSSVYVDEPREGRGLPEVRISSPSGESWVSGPADVDEELSQRLGRSVRLATADAEGSEAMYGDGPVGSFWDVGSVHLVSTGALARLSEAVPSSTFDARRFRPNLVIDSGEAVGFPEDEWLGATLAIGTSVRMRVTSRCPRCVMTTHAQADLPNDREILRTAARANAANVGIYAEVVVPGAVRLGDPLRVVPFREASGAG